MNAAIVHYWLVHRRGGEHVLDAIARLLPTADLISHVIDPRLLTGPLSGRETRQTFISKLPFARRRYAAYLPLMPLALEMMDMSNYDLIVSSEAGPAKWVIKDPDAYHVCYCHSPLRYIWDQRTIYMTQIPKILRPMAELYASGLRRSDQTSAMRVDHFVANSSFVARRIESYYRRDATIIHPPVNTDNFSPSAAHEDYYLLAGEIRGYKAGAAAVEACTRLSRRLVVIGGGDSSALRRLAGPTVEFLGRVDQNTFKNKMANCRALLFPGVEDFGIIPVEAMASGRPVIGRAKGGLLDSVIHGHTGILYSDASPLGIERAILEFEAEENTFRSDNCVKHASKFSTARFDKEFSKVLSSRAIK